MATRVFLLCLILSMSYSTSVFANKDCYTCNPDYVPGNPGANNQTLGQIAQISMALLQGNDSTLMDNLYSYCMSFKNGGVNGNKTFRKKVIKDMEENMINGSVDPYFLEAGCSPDYIGQTYSPIAHLATELPSEYTSHLEVIRKYFIEKKKPDLFKKFINAKNTKGHTSLDYVEYLLEKKLYIKQERENIQEYISYLCSHGGEYSLYKNKSCGESQIASK